MDTKGWLSKAQSGSPRPLPHGWEQGFDNKSGRIYYFNRQTQQSSWDVPSDDMANPQQSESRATPQRDMGMNKRGGGMAMQQERGAGMQRGVGQSHGEPYQHGVSSQSGYGNQRVDQQQGNQRSNGREERDWREERNVDDRRGRTLDDYNYARREQGKGGGRGGEDEGQKGWSNYRGHTSSDEGGKGKKGGYDKGGDEGGKGKKGGYDKGGSYKGGKGKDGDDGKGGKNREDGWWPEAWGRQADHDWYGSKGWGGFGKGGGKGRMYEDPEAWRWEAWPEWSYSSNGKGKGKGKDGWYGAAWDSGYGKGSGKDWPAQEWNKGKGKGKTDKDRGGDREDRKEGGKGTKSSGKGDASKSVTAKGLTDKTLENFCTERSESESEMEGTQLDIANNQLTGTNFNFFQDICLKMTSLAIVKLHKNLLCDAAAPFLAEICKECPALAELHLSHNLITSIGAEKIVTAACEARAADKDETPPALWLRLEYNEVEEPQKMMEAWKSRDMLVHHYQKGASRFHLAKGVHLPYFVNQGKPSGYVHGENNEPAWKVKQATRRQAEEEGPEEKHEKKENFVKEAQLKWKPKVQKEEAASVAEEAKEEDDKEDKVEAVNNIEKKVEAGDDNDGEKAS